MQPLDVYHRSPDRLQIRSSPGTPPHLHTVYPRTFFWFYLLLVFIDGQSLSDSTVSSRQTLVHPHLCASTPIDRPRNVDFDYPAHPFDTFSTCIYFILRLTFLFLYGRSPLITPPCSTVLLLSISPPLSLSPVSLDKRYTRSCK